MLIGKNPQEICELDQNNQRAQTRSVVACITTPETLGATPGTSQQNHQAQNVPSSKKRQQDEESPKVSSKRAKYERRPINEIRYDSKDHLPDVDKSRGSRCKNENCKFTTHIFCTKCRVHLCLLADRNCYKKFHTLGSSK